ncbi:MAG TPA: hypothetical protein VG603_16045 [Chitinophagales bacterium]|nr:hypothetical protein [Chitinophagales bacterium]
MSHIKIKDGELVPLGSFSFFTNHDGAEISDALAKALSEKIADWCENWLECDEDTGQIRITNVETHIGCVITTISIAIAVTGGGVGITKFLADYPKIRAGVLQMLDDAKKLCFWRKPKREELEPRPENKPERIPTDEEIKWHLGLDDGLDKYHMVTDDSFTFFKKTTIRKKVAVYKSEIIEHIEAIKIETTEAVIKKTKDKK